MDWGRAGVVVCGQGLGLGLRLGLSLSFVVDWLFLGLGAGSVEDLGANIGFDEVSWSGAELGL